MTSTTYNDLEHFFFELNIYIYIECPTIISKSANQHTYPVTLQLTQTQSVQRICIADLVAMGSAHTWHALWWVFATNKNAVKGNQRMSKDVKGSYITIAEVVLIPDIGTQKLESRTYFEDCNVQHSLNSQGKPGQLIADSMAPNVFSNLIRPMQRTEAWIHSTLFEAKLRWNRNTMKSPMYRTLHDI